MRPALTATAAGTPLGRAAWSWLVLCVSMLAACEEARISAPLEVSALDDAGAAVVGVRTWSERGSLGVTGEDGQLRAQLDGRPGGTVVVRAVCPRGFVHAPIERRLRLPSAPPGDAVTLTVRCRPLLHRLALAVRAAAPVPPELPLRIDGEVVGQTGPGGVAHLLLHRPAGAEVRLVFDTGGHPGLTPRDPVNLLRVPDRDSIAIVERRFEEAQPARRPARQRRERAAPRVLPYRIR